MKCTFYLWYDEWRENNWFANYIALMAASTIGEEIQIQEFLELLMHFSSTYS